MAGAVSLRVLAFTGLLKNKARLRVPARAPFRTGQRSTQSENLPGKCILALVPHTSEHSVALSTRTSHHIIPIQLVLKDWFSNVNGLGSGGTSLVPRGYHSNIGGDLVKPRDEVATRSETNYTAFRLMGDTSLEGASLEQEISHNLRIDVLRQKLAIPLPSRAIW